MGKERLASFIFYVHDAFLGVAGGLYTDHAFRVDDFLHEFARVGVDVFEAHDVDFVNDEEGGFPTKERFDGME